MSSRLDSALDALNQACPEAVRRVILRIEESGGVAYLVGGIVRDALLGRLGGDWDIATDLEPAQVAGLFEHVVRAGEKHGTIMVIESGVAVEVTTFRGEGPYLDGRRPSFVEFHHEVERDLARRDFTMNAIAVDLESGEWIDPFDGVLDIERRCIRCVGDPLERFREDGLRPLRAIRFASTLGFRLAPSTSAVLGAQRATFESVAWERKRVEIEKLLVGPAVTAAIDLLHDSSLLLSIAPELTGGGDDLHSLKRLDEEPWIRLVEWGLRRGVTGERLGAIAKRWKSATETQQRVARVSIAFAELEGRDPDEVSLRRWLARNGLTAARGALTVARAREDQVWSERTERLLLRPPPHRLSDLAVNGNDVMGLGVRGPQVGRVLAELLDHVLEKPERNQRGLLLKLAHRLSTALDAMNGD